MKILAISGSARAVSTNTALLRAMAEIAKPHYQVTVFAALADLPVFSPDFEDGPLPRSVQQFAQAIDASDGMIIASPEYVHAIPGGLKNAIDWLVSRQEIVGKPIALMHASHRGDDMLAQLRLVMGTVSERFTPDIFLRFELMKLTPDEITDHMALPMHKAAVTNYLERFAELSNR